MPFTNGTRRRAPPCFLTSEVPLATDEGYEASALAGGELMLSRGRC